MDDEEATSEMFLGYLTKDLAGKMTDVLVTKSCNLARVWTYISLLIGSKSVKIIYDLPR